MSKNKKVFNFFNDIHEEKFDRIVGPSWYYPQVRVSLSMALPEAILHKNILHLIHNRSKINRYGCESKYLRNSRDSCFV